MRDKVADDLTELGPAVEAGGEMGGLIRSRDWASTPLGPPSAWPASLRTALGICLGAKAPMVVFWGRDLVLLYNDAYAPILGAKHPASFGRPARDCWDEVWPMIGDVLLGVLATGRAAGTEDRLTYRDPAGGAEQSQLTFSYSPVWDESGRVGGVLGTVAENTGRVAGERRLRVLQDVAHASHALITSLNTDEICQVVADLLLPDHGLWCAVSVVHRDELGGGELRVHHSGSSERTGEVLARAFEQSGPRVRELLGIDEVLRTRHAAARVLDESAAAEFAGLPGRYVITLPMLARDHLVGAITVARSERAWRTAGDQAYLEELSRRAALALDNAALYEAQQHIALNLQRSLLPRDLPSSPSLLLAARYLPGARGAKVGGDWYDALSLPGDRIGFSIGDVVGRGVHAAARMGQLRTALRSYALECDEPARVLARLDAFLQTAGDLRFATCLYGIYDPRTAELRLANAGHLRPWLLAPGQRPRLLDIGPGVPLGGASRLVAGRDKGFAFATARAELPDEGTVLLYTDGLVESRHRLLDQGLERLRTALDRDFDTPDEVCAAALRAMGIDERSQDDTALVALRRPRAAPRPDDGDE